MQDLQDLQDLQNAQKSCELYEQLKYRFLINNYQFDITKVVPANYHIPHIIDEATNYTNPISIHIDTKKDTKLDITKGFISRLMKVGESNLNWDPFVCKVVKILFNKKLKRWFLVVSDIENEFRVAIATQCFKLFKSDTDEEINKGDVIYVEYYAVTTVHPNTPKFIMFTKIHKIS